MTNMCYVVSLLVSCDNTMAVFMAVVEEEERQRCIIKARVFRDRVHPLDAYDDDEIRGKYRLTRELIIHLHDMIHEDLDPKTNRNHAVPAMLQIFCALRYYATGTFQSVIGEGLGLHRSTVSRIITKVTNAICRLKNHYIMFPRTQDAIQETKEDFYDLAGLPNTLGAIDGSHVFIQGPTADEHLYVSRKGGHSINVLAVCNAKLKYTYVLAKFPGSTNDAYAWMTSRLFTLFDDRDIDDGWLIGDSG